VVAEYRQSICERLVPLLSGPFLLEGMSIPIHSVADPADPTFSQQDYLDFTEAEENNNSLGTGSPKKQQAGVGAARVQPDIDWLESGIRDIWPEIIRFCTSDTDVQTLRLVCRYLQMVVDECIPCSVLLDEHLLACQGLWHLSQTYQRFKQYTIYIDSMHMFDDLFHGGSNSFGIEEVSLRMSEISWLPSSLTYLKLGYNTQVSMDALMNLPKSLRELCVEPIRIVGAEKNGLLIPLPSSLTKLSVDSCDLYELLDVEESSVTFLSYSPPMHDGIVATFPCRYPLKLRELRFRYVKWIGNSDVFAKCKNLRKLTLEYCSSLESVNTLENTKFELPPCLEVLTLETDIETDGSMELFKNIFHPSSSAEYPQSFKEVNLSLSWKDDTHIVCEFLKLLPRNIERLYLDLDNLPAGPMELSDTLSWCVSPEGQLQNLRLVSVRCGEGVEVFSLENLPKSVTFRIFHAD